MCIKLIDFSKLTFWLRGWETVCHRDFSFILFDQFSKNDLCHTLILRYFKETSTTKEFFVNCITCKYNGSAAPVSSVVCFCWDTFEMIECH